MIYLASPYSHSDPAVREARYQAALRASAALMLQGELVFSPIAHSHPIEGVMATQQAHGFWMRQCIDMLRRCDRFAVLTIDGWQGSRGVRAEAELATQLGMNTELIAP